jgi:hypothetical protein
LSLDRTSEEKNPKSNIARFVSDGKLAERRTPRAI